MVCQRLETTSVICLYRQVICHQPLCEHLAQPINVVGHSLGCGNGSIPVSAGERAGGLLGVDYHAFVREVRGLVDSTFKVPRDRRVLEKLVLEGICHRFIEFLMELDGVLPISSAASVLDFHKAFWVGCVSENLGWSLCCVHIVKFE